MVPTPDPPPLGGSVVRFRLTRHRAWVDATGAIANDVPSEVCLGGLEQTQAARSERIAAWIGHFIGSTMMSASTRGGVVGRLRLIIISAAVLVGAGSAQAGTIWEWTHQAAGEDWANIFDGGPVDFGSGATKGPDDPRMPFSALDHSTRLGGVLAASYSTGGRSSVEGLLDTLRVSVDFRTAYTADFLPDADRPGGEGAGSMWSVIEFVMPADELEWFLSFTIDEAPGFSGSAHLVIENLTQSATLFDLTDSFITFDPITLFGHTGDVIRFSYSASGEGSVPAGVISFNSFRARVLSTFTVPEPGAVVLLGIGALLLPKRRSLKQNRSGGARRDGG